ncbi:MAG: hypothetical protein O3B95_06175 [Chloroflexi bacterium]|nr:hypothetical protein [Chloroflexota bacterium]
MMQRDRNRVSQRLMDALNFNSLVSDLSDDRIRSVHLELLEKAVSSGRLSVTRADSAVGEASLLARLTREVERRTRRDNQLWVRFLNRRARRAWEAHDNEVQALESKLVTIALKNQSTSS